MFRRNPRRHRVVCRCRFRRFRRSRRAGCHRRKGRSWWMSNQNPNPTSSRSPTWRRRCRSVHRRRSRSRHHPPNPTTRYPNRTPPSRTTQTHSSRMHRSRPRHRPNRMPRSQTTIRPSRRRCRRQPQRVRLPPQAPEKPSPPRCQHACADSLKPYDAVPCWPPRCLCRTPRRTPHPATCDVSHSESQANRHFTTQSIVFCGCSQAVLSVSR